MSMDEGRARADSDDQKDHGRKLPPLVRAQLSDLIARARGGVEQPDGAETPVSFARVVLAPLDDEAERELLVMSLDRSASLARRRGVASVFVEVSAREQTMSWPLVISGLDERASEIIERAVELNPWIGALARIATDEDKAVSLAIATEPPSETSRASAVFAIAHGDFAWDAEIARSLEAKVGSTVTARTSSADPIQWLVELLVQLSHDWPMDIAFELANRAANSPSWALLYGHPDDIERSRLSSVADRTLREADKLADNVGSMPASELDEAKARLGDLLKHATWQHEMGDPQKVVAEIEFIAKSIGKPTTDAQRSAPERDAEGRRLSAACVSGEGATKRGRPTAPLAAGEEGFVEVDVRAPEKDRATHPSAIVDIVSAEPGKDEFDLDVFFVTELGTQSGRLRLPRSGTSNRTVFRYVRPAGSKIVTALVVLLYQSHLVQAGELAINPDQHEVVWRETLLVERALGELSGRVDNGAVTITSDGAQANALVQDFVEGMGVPHANVVTECIRMALQSASDAASSSSALTDEKFRQLLVTVARAGAMLRDEILSEEVRTATHVQLIERCTGAWFPVEFVYDAPDGIAPTESAKVCDRPLTDPAARGCDGQCPCLQSPEDWVCPRRFWGTSKTIERWSLKEQEKRPELKRDSNQLVFCSPRGDRRELAVFREVVAGFSNLVETETRSSIAQLCQWTNGAASSNGWQGVKDIVSAKQPGLHVVLAHHESAASKASFDALELDGDFRSLPDINRTVVTRQSSVAPLVLLLACNSLSPDEGIASPAQRYLNSGAAAVIATTTLVWAPVVARVVFDLARTLSKPEVRVPLAEWLRTARLRLLLAKDPTAFSLVAYGDANWILAGWSCAHEIPDGAPSLAADNDANRELKPRKPSKPKGTT